MSLKTKVKAGNITNLSDARYCAGMGVDWLSFPADVVDPVTFKEITDWVTGPEYILEVNETTPLHLIEQYAVNTLEMHFGLLNMIDLLPSMSWIVSIPLSAWNTTKKDLIRYKDKIRYIVVHLDESNLQELNDIATHIKVFVNHSEKYPIDELLLLPIEGINIAGSNELKPGLKDFDKLASILEELEVLD